MIQLARNEFARSSPSGSQPPAGVQTPGAVRARFLTAAEVAATLRVSTMTVYRLIQAGQLPAVRVGKSYRVREEDVDGYLAGTYTQAV